MRYIVEESDKKDIIRLYEKGLSRTQIAAATGYPENTVKGIIKNATGSYTEYKNGNSITGKMFVPEKIPVRKTQEEIKAQVLKLYCDEGLSIEQIIMKTKDLSRTDIEDVLLEEKIIDKVEETGRVMYTVEDLPSLIRECKVGDRFRLSRIHDYVTVTIQEKYNRFVKTDKGTFMYTDLLLGKKLQ